MEYVFPFKNTINLKTFLEDVTKCEQEVLFESTEGDKLALKSSLSRFILYSVCNQPELLEGQPDTKEIGNKLQEILEPYYRPKYIWTTDCIPQTENGKVNRAKCRILAKQMLTTFYTHTLTP